jgi:hypothetical protein
MTSGFIDGLREIEELPDELTPAGFQMPALGVGER